MDNLDVLIGFSVVMLIVAQLSSIAVNAASRALNLRGKEFEKFRQELGQTIKTVGHNYKVKAQEIDIMCDALNSRFNAHLTPVDPQKSSFKQPNINVTALANNVIESTAPDALTAQTKTTLNDEFELDEQISTLRYRQKCTYLSFAAAFIISIVLNINALHVFEVLSNKPQVLEQTNLLATNIVSLEQSLANPDLGQNESSELRRQIRLLNTELEGLPQTELNIGWLFENERWTQVTSNLGYAFIGWFSTALFAGLGAPFWHQLLRQLLSWKSSQQTSSNKYQEANRAVAQPAAQNPGFPDSGIRIPCGAEGSFIVTNVVHQAEDATLTVDIELDGQPQPELWTEDELERQILEKSEKYFPGMIRSVVFRQGTLIRIQDLLAQRQY